MAALELDRGRGYPLACAITHPRQVTDRITGAVHAALRSARLEGEAGSWLGVRFFASLFHGLPVLPSWGPRPQAARVDPVILRQASRDVNL